MGKPTLGFWIFCWGRRIWGWGWKRRAGSAGFLPVASPSLMASRASCDMTGARDIEAEFSVLGGSSRFAYSESPPVRGGGGGCADMAGDWL